MSKPVYYLATSNPHKNIRVRSEDDIGFSTQRFDDPLDWSVANTLKPAVMKRARTLAKESGLKLRMVKTVAVRFEGE